MFDEVTCRFPLPAPGCEGLVFQTKDTPSQFLERYEIREDGTLWRQAYDTVDRSDPNAQGILRLAGIMARTNERWEREYLSGSMYFYTSAGEEWFEFLALFMEGVLQEVRRVEEDEKRDFSRSGLHPIPLERMRDSVRRKEREACAQVALNLAERLDRDSDLHGAEVARRIAERILSEDPPQDPKD